MSQASCFRLGNGNGLQTRLLKLQDVLVSRLVFEEPVVRHGDTVVARVGTRITLTIHVVQRAAVAAHADRLRIPAGGNEADDAMRRGAAKRDDGDSIHAAIGDVEGALIGREREAVGRGARKLPSILPAQDAGRRGGVNLFDDAIACRLDDRDAIAVVCGHVESRLRAVEQNVVGIADNGNAREEPR